MPTKEEINEFVDYVNHFYGFGGICDLGCNREDVQLAVEEYIQFTKLKTSIRWCDGGLIDRKRVKAALDFKGFKEVRAA
ncbi:MAG: hypothetical protein ACJAS1_001625 [Oleiphilaceae bacterium]|jgi:hypothetical protein